jgi:hypothetical protein
MASSIRVSKLGDLVLVPPQLPGYLSAVHELKPIMGMPAERDVKAIHATIRSLNALVQSKHTLLPTYVLESNGS